MKYFKSTTQLFALLILSIAISFSSCKDEDPKPDCNDNCDNTADSFNEDTNKCDNILTEPDCDDGDADTEDSYDADNCTCVNMVPPNGRYVCLYQ